MIELLVSTEGPVHVAVMPREVLERLAPRPGERLLDLTTGAAGHAELLLEAAGEGARLVGLDRDPRILEIARRRLAAFGDAVHLAGAVSDRFEAVLDELGLETVDVAFLDVGVSSLQLDSAERGFSFRHEGPLDMRMGTEGPTAEDLLRDLDEAELERIFREYGEEPSSRRIARRLVELRRRRLPRTTVELARFIESLAPARPKGRSAVHPATRVFQALRIAVNDELGVLERTLERLLPRLAPGGRIGVLSFHSLEDGIVKRAFREAAREGRLEVLTRRPDRPSEEEIRGNPRARSARLRAARRLEEDAS